MTKRDSTYQNTRVQILQGGQIFSIDSDGWFDFYGESITGQEMAAQLLFGANVSAIATGAVSTAFSQLNIPNSAKYVTFSMTSTLTAGSACLTSGCLAGQEMYIWLRSGSCASGTVQISTSGVTLVKANGSALSIITLYNSTNSTGGVHLVCLTDGEWSIVGVGGERGATNPSVTYS